MVIKYKQQKTNREIGQKKVESQITFKKKKIKPQGDGVVSIAIHRRSKLPIPEDVYPEVGQASTHCVPRRYCAFLHRRQPTGERSADETRHEKQFVKEAHEHDVLLGVSVNPLSHVTEGALETYWHDRPKSPLPSATELEGQREVHVPRSGSR